MTKRVALITGVEGQDGVYLSRLLARQGYKIVGTTRPSSLDGARMKPYLTDVVVEQADIRDRERVADLLERYRPDEFYNLAGFSSVGASWDHAELVAEVNGTAVLRILETLRTHRDRTGQSPRFYQASSSEMFGLAPTQPQDEHTAHHPRSPYAAAKSFAHYLVMNYRESHGLFACNGILYNHESPLRPLNFVTRKITRAAAEISLGLRDHVSLGNLQVKRDWGAAEDYVRAMWLMLQQPEPDDYVVASGTARPLSDLLECAFASAGLEDPTRFVVHDESLIRPVDVPELRGDADHARAVLGWHSAMPFPRMIEQMVRADTLRLQRGQEEGSWVLDLPTGRDAP
jgi:GDPmannose 4,6-dehydratase